MDYVKHVLVTTDAEGGSLRQIVNDEGFPSTSFPGGVSAAAGTARPGHGRAGSPDGADCRRRQRFSEASGSGGREPPHAAAGWRGPVATACSRRASMR